MNIFYSFSFAGSLSLYMFYVLKILDLLIMSLLAWDLEVSNEEDHPQLLVNSRVKTSLSVSVCSKTGTHGCEDTQTILVDVVSST